MLIILTLQLITKEGKGNEDPRSEKSNDTQGHDPKSGVFIVHFKDKKPRIIQGIEILLATLNRHYFTKTRKRKSGAPNTKVVRTKNINEYS